LAKEKEKIREIMESEIMAELPLEICIKTELVGNLEQETNLEIETTLEQESNLATSNSNNDVEIAKNTQNLIDSMENLESMLYWDQLGKIIANRFSLLDLLIIKSKYVFKKNKTEISFIH
jgi:hypothetical protein